MTRKDYQLIASQIKSLMLGDKSHISFGDKMYKAGASDTVNVLCRALKADNPRFDEEKFKQACGL